MKNILFFDIDSVLNGAKDNAILNKHFINEKNMLVENLIKKALELEERNIVKFLRNKKEEKTKDGKPYPIDLGNYVNIEIANKLAKIIKEKNVYTIGISSWFTSRKNKDDLKLISDCLGFKVNEVGETGGCDFRFSGALQWLKENIKENEKCNVVYLDDDVRFLNKEVIENYLIFNSQYNGIIISPYIDGINENQFNQIEKWFS